MAQNFLPGEGKPERSSPWGSPSTPLASSQRPTATPCPQAPTCPKGLSLAAEAPPPLPCTSVALRPSLRGQQQLWRVGKDPSGVEEDTGLLLGVEDLGGGGQEQAHKSPEAASPPGLAPPIGPHGNWRLPLSGLLSFQPPLASGEGKYCLQKLGGGDALAWSESLRVLLWGSGTASWGYRPLPSTSCRRASWARDRP